MENLSEKDRIMQDEVSLWQNQQKLEDKILIDVQVTNLGGDPKYSFSCPLDRKNMYDLRGSNAKKKLKKANIKVKGRYSYGLGASLPGFSRELKKDQSLFQADSQVVLSISNVGNSKPWTSTLQKMKFFLSKNFCWRRFLFDECAKVDLAQILLFSQNSRTIVFND